MNYEPNPEQLAGLSLDFLDDELVGAVEEGDVESIIDALSRQPKTEVTIALSNHLIARSFLVSQKSNLVALENTFLKGLQEEVFIGRIQELIGVAKEEYHNIFVSENRDDKYEKLSTDDVFRDFIVMDAEEDVPDECIDDENFISSVTLAKWQLIETPIAALDSPSDTLKWAKEMEDNIILSMYQMLKEIDRCVLSGQNILWIQNEISARIDSLDRNILGCF